MLRNRTSTQSPPDQFSPNPPLRRMFTVKGSQVFGVVKLLRQRSPRPPTHQVGGFHQPTSPPRVTQLGISKIPFAKAFKLRIHPGPSVNTCAGTHSVAHKYSRTINPSLRSKLAMLIENRRQSFPSPIHLHAQRAQTFASHRILHQQKSDKTLEESLKDVGTPKG